MAATTTPDNSSAWRVWPHVRWLRRRYRVRQLHQRLLLRPRHQQLPRVDSVSRHRLQAYVYCYCERLEHRRTDRSVVHIIHNSGPVRSRERRLRRHPVRHLRCRIRVRQQRMRCLERLDRRADASIAGTAGGGRGRGGASAVLVGAASFSSCLSACLVLCDSLSPSRHLLSLKSISGLLAVVVLSTTPQTGTNFT